MLEFCDLRARIIILFFASSGMRLGGLVGLKNGDVRPIYSPVDPSKVLAAHLVVYRGTEDEYDTFASPEAWYSYAEYQVLRIKCGERLNEDSPFILSRFSPRTLKEGKAKPIDGGTVTNIVSAICYKAGITEQSKHYKNRFNLKRIHGMRKFFLTSLKSVRTSEGQPAIEFLHSRLMGNPAWLNYTSTIHQASNLQVGSTAVGAGWKNETFKVKLQGDGSIYDARDITAMVFPLIS